MLRNKYFQHKETIHNFIWRAMQIGAKQGTTFLIFFIAAYFLIPEDLGLFSYLMAIVGLLLIICDFGLSPSVSKYVAELKTTKSKNLNKILFSISIVIMILSTLVSLFIIFFGKHIFEDYKLILYFLPYLFFLPLSSVADGIYRGLKEFKKLSIINIAIAIFVIPLSFLLIKTYGMIGAIISQNILFLLLAICLFIFRKETKFKFDKKITKKILKYALIIGFTGIAYYMYNKADILILKYFDYIVEIGYYEILNKIFSIIFIPFIIFGQIIAPNITRLYIQKKFINIKKKFLKHLLIIFFMGIFLSITLYFLMPLLIKLFLEKYFVPETILILNLLLLILPFRIIASVVSQGHTIATGNAHFSLWTMIPAGIVNVILDIIFISKFGFIGVVYSTLICYVFATISFIMLYYFKLNRLIKRGNSETC